MVAAGATSKGQLANRTAMALASLPGTVVVEFPGDHGGFAAPVVSVRPEGVFKRMAPSHARRGHLRRLRRRR